MASYTIFSQADPFPHNEYFLELLKHPATLGKVQTLSRLYLSEGEFETPKAAGKHSQLHLNFDCPLKHCLFTDASGLYACLPWPLCRMRASQVTC